MKISSIQSALTLILAAATRSSSVHADHSAEDPNKHALLNKVQPFGFQSTQSQGHDIASSIAFSPNPEQGYFLTGTTTGIALSPEAEQALHVGMHCYVMQLKPFEDNWVWAKKFGAYKDGFPVGTTCTSVDTLNFKNKDEHDASTRVVVTGYTQGDDIFSPEIGILPFSQIEADSEVATMETNKVNGFVMILDVPTNLAQRKEVNSVDIKLIGGKMLTGFAVQYPVKVTTISDTDIAVASLVTDDASLNLQAKLQQGLGEVGDFEPMFEYGNFFDVRVERLSFLGESKPVMQRVWSKTFSTTSGRGAHVTSLAYDFLDDNVIFGGSTHGRGDAFGKFDPLQSDGVDFDGYVTKLEASSGEIRELEDGSKAAFRLETHPGKDEFVNSMCAHGRALYIVGSTDSIIDPTFERKDDEKTGPDNKMDAFIQKRQMGNMRVVWTRQISATNMTGNMDLDNQHVEGLGCAVNHDADIVYLSGVVSNGASVVEGEPGVGENDVFVYALNGLSGTPSEKFPITQVGSFSDDLLAKDNGGIAIDQYGNAILYGTSRGSLVKKKEIGNSRFAQSYSDIFLMSFLVDGAEHVQPIERPGTGPVFTVTSRASKKSRTRRSLEISGITLLCAASVIVLFLLAYHFGKRRTVNEIENQQDKDIAKYMEEFEAGKKAANGNDDNGQIYDISAYYGKSNFAVGKEDDDAGGITLPGEVSFDSTSAGADTEAGKKTTYEELMESYKNIQKDLTADDPSAAKFVIDTPDTELDSEVI